MNDIRKFFYTIYKNKDLNVRPETIKLLGEKIRNMIFDIQFTSVTQSCLTLCNPMDCSTPGLPVHHQLLEFIQTHVH